MTQTLLDKNNPSNWEITALTDVQFQARFRQTGEIFVGTMDEVEAHIASFVNPPEGSILWANYQMESGKTLGRTSPGYGPIEEIEGGDLTVSAVDVELSPPTASLGITNAQEGFELIEAALGYFEAGVSAAIAKKLNLAGGTLTGPLEMVEVGTAPAAPGANTVSIYAEDNGSGKTRLMARFATGAPVQIAIEP